MSEGNNVQLISQVILLVLLLISPSSSLFSQAKEEHKTILWQQEAEGGVNNLFMLTDPSNTTHLIVQASSALYSLNPYTGKIEWKTIPSKQVNQRPLTKSTMSDSTLDDIDGDSIPELLVTRDFCFNDYDCGGALLIYDSLNGTLKHSFYFGNYTSDVSTGVFKPCKGKGIVLVGEAYYSNTYYGYQYLMVLDSVTFEPVYTDDSLANDYYPGTSGAIDDAFLYDLTEDGYDEIILSIGNGTVNSTVVVLNGADFHVLWRQYLPREIFQASDVEYHDFTGDGTVDLLLTDGASGLALVDGRNGTLLWFTSEYGHVDSTLADIDDDGKIEVITTRLEDLTILDGLTGAVEVAKTLPFTFDGGNLAVVDIANNGSEYILSNSLYGNLYLFSPTFDLVDVLDTPGGWICSLLLYDLTGEGTLEIIGGSFFSSLVFAYIYVGEVTPLPQPFPVFAVIVPSVIVFSGGISFYLSRKYRSNQ